MSISSPFPGRIERLSNFRSEFVLDRHIDVWLPPAWDEDPDARFPVLYMHDGQNLFYPELSSMGDTWQVAERIDALTREGKIRPCIVVGIWNSRRRFREYCPGKPFAAMPDLFKEKVEEILGSSEMLGGDYLAFLVNELKPEIDGHFPTFSTPENTFVMGSSMGGLISLYALLEYPWVFGGAACLSTHWPLSDKPVAPDFADLMGELIKERLRSEMVHKIYFDYGTETLDAIYEPYQKRIDKVMKTVGFGKQQWITKKFPGHGHTETDWARRLHHPLQFLLGK
jgi:enterochelin esterase-like enzyme